ncbi:patatin [Fictibacillus macauensis ZFHKF-1]|uniref:Patatin n=1 Tax=Fictibacillus macauensis ZFHKF-1 TaxID=1196324 RepID=I8AKD4_9BACL|nr:patatin family protein [Fictibacillus macauensis]EIT86312.1 patatin [Fictibacillus macauensis ZFHKF-1]
MQGTGLVLEGGGMRGLYTAGVLDYFMEHDLYFPYVIGVSAGACNAMSYLSRQKGRNRVVNLDFVRHPDYISYRNLLLKKKSLFGMDLIFDDIPNKHVPFDFETFYQAQEQLVIGTTDVTTGQPIYYNSKEHEEHIMTILRSSSSIPFMSPPVSYNEQMLVDGGVSDPIPIRKAQWDGHRRNVIILTQNVGYRKKKPKWNWLAKQLYKKLPGLMPVLLERYKTYNETLAYIEQLERKQEVFVIRPLQKLKVSRTERNPYKLAALYEQGVEDAALLHNRLESWLYTL